MTFGVEEIAQRLSRYTAGARGDHTLNPDILPPPPHREAAVLIPLVAERDALDVIFTQRTAHLHDHAGQVSFPGGSRDAGDADAIATALREAAEEIGLAAGNVRVLGLLDSYITRSGFRVTPVVGFVEGISGAALSPDPFEVEEIFRVPLPYILSPEVLVRQSAMKNGVLRHYYAMDFEKFHIWGATAGMLKNLVEVLDDV